tara:strand:- start:69 stop:449 length:381 start_codon:yes stop_codon:yes gene_type:complete
MVFKKDIDMRDYINDNIGKYLEKSGDSLNEFKDTLSYTKFLAGFNDDGQIYGWIQYSINDRVFYVITAYTENKSKSIFRLREWEEIKSIAKKEKCKTIRMITKRDPKPFKRLYKLKTIQTIMELEL